MKTERITKHKADQDFLEKYTSLHKTEKEKKNGGWNELDHSH